MKQWQSKVHFRDLLEDYDVDTADELSEIQRIIPKWVDRFETIPSLKSFTESLKLIKTEAGFNKWLNKVYDHCDRNRIWIEL